MASANLKDELICSICLSIYKEPMMLGCGHNFCRICTDRVLNTQDGSAVYSCPECRQEFRERPALIRNITLCNVVENVLSAQPLAEVMIICCTYCIHSPVPAVKSCLHCEASLCDNHLRVHSKEAEHVLMEPTTSYRNRKCTVHKEMLKYYCVQDAICICASCGLIGDHSGHIIEPLDQASTKKKNNIKHLFQELREETQKRINSLQESRTKAQNKAAGETERVTALFIDIRRRLDDLEKRVLSEISRQEEQVSLSVSDLIQQLEKKKDELSRKMRHIEELCNIIDPLTVLQGLDTRDLCDLEKRAYEERGEHDEGDEERGGHDRGDEDTRGHDGGVENTRGHDGGVENTRGHDGGDEGTRGHDGGDEDTRGYDGGDEDTRGYDGGDDDTKGHNGDDLDTGGHDKGDDDTKGHDGGDEDTGGHDKTHVADVDVITGMLHAGFSDLVTYLQKFSSINPIEISPNPHGASAMLNIKNSTTQRNTEMVTQNKENAEKPQTCVWDPADIFLDVNTASNYFHISDDLKYASYSKTKQNCPDAAEKFQCPQVMSSTSFSSGRHYWDVEISGSDWWRVGMCYPSIDRKGGDPVIGNNKMSWALWKRGRHFTQSSVIHDSKDIRLPYQISSDRVRICLDYEAGELSMFELREPVRHIYTFKATFTQPLHAALCLGSFGSIKILGASSNCEKLS